MAIIQQGDDCVNRGSNLGAGYNLIAAANPASETDNIEVIKVWANTNITGAETGSFATPGVGSSGVATCHGNCSGANMSFAAGSCVTKTSAGGDFTAYEAANGEFFGIWIPASSGTMELDASGDSGMWDRNSDVVGTDLTGNFTWDAGYSFSAYGAAAAAGGSTTLTAAQGSAAITTQAANLLWHRSLKAEQGSAAVTGQASNLLWHQTLKAEQGAAAITGQDATFNIIPAAGANSMTAEQGAVAITGQAANLLWHHSLKAEQAGVAITGQAARLQKTWSLKCNSAQIIAYVSIGADIPGLPLDRLYWHHNLKAEQGAAAITGQAARLQWHRKIKVEQASVAITTQAALLTWNRLLKAEAAALAITGNDIYFYASRLLRAEQGAVAIAGQDATLTYSGAPVLVAPAERTCTVGAESRAMIIKAENRTIIVPAEARHVDI